MNPTAELAGPVDVLARLAEPGTRRDPYPLLHLLRDREPVHQTTAGFYLLTRHADVVWTMGGTGRVFRGPVPAQLAERYPDAVRHPSRRLFFATLAMKDPPEHTRLRALVTGALDTARVAGLRHRVDAISDRLLDALATPLRDGEVVDLHAALTVPLSTHVFGELVGVPEADRAWLGGLVTNIYIAAVPMADERIASYVERFAVADEQTAQLTGYFRDMFARRRRRPGDDLVSALAGRLDDDELLAMVWILWVAGVDTAAGGLDHCVRALLHHRDQAHRVHLETAGFCEEALRLYGSSLFAGVVRIATRDVRFGDVTVPEGADVRPSTAAANRDPAVFTDPDRFDPGRPHGRVLSFGHGIRLCPGADLSRVEMVTCLPRLHTRFPNLVAAGEPTWHDGVSTRLLRRLPAALEG